MSASTVVPESKFTQILQAASSKPGTEVKNAAKLTATEVTPTVASGGKSAFERALQKHGKVQEPQDAPQPQEMNGLYQTYQEVPISMIEAGEEEE